MKYIIKNSYNLYYCGMDSKAEVWDKNISLAEHYSKYNPLRFIVLNNLKRNGHTCSFVKAIFMKTNFVMQHKGKM